MTEADLFLLVVHLSPHLAPDLGHFCDLGVWVLACDVVSLRIPKQHEGSHRPLRHVGVLVFNSTGTYGAVLESN